MWSCLSGVIQIRSFEFDHVAKVWDDLKTKIHHQKLSSFENVAISLCQQGNGTIQNFPCVGREEGETLRSIRKPEQPGTGDLCTGYTMPRHHCSTCYGVF